MYLDNHFISYFYYCYFHGNIAAYKFLGIFESGQGPTNLKYDPGVKGLVGAPITCF